VQHLLAINWQLFEAINQPAGHEQLLDPLMVFGANDVIFLAPLLLLALWLGLAVGVARGQNAAVPAMVSDRLRAVGRQLALLACLGVVLALALNLTLGHLLYEPRPFVSHPALVHELIPHPADASFPSDHTAVMSAVATMLLVYLAVVLAWTRRTRASAPNAEQLRLRRLRALAGTLAAVAVVAVLYVGVARVYAGLHYPGDIAGGAICGVIGSACAAAIRPVAAPALAPVIRLAERLRLA
jgi:undecaprenyl-diphosphatase